MNIIRKIKLFAQKKEVPDVTFRKSYSQCGDDLNIDYVFRWRGIAHPSYIDIGANHPYSISNTAIFYENGCRGINVEANPQLIFVFQAARPDDINLNVGIGDKEG